MKILIQRVNGASIKIHDKETASIGKGLVVFLGITHSDTLTEASLAAKKVLNMRIFDDEKNGFHLSLVDCKADILIVSQFTLYADCSSGRRPSFTMAASPQQAEPIYQFFVHEVEKEGIQVQTGVFGADMQVTLQNDGPVTLFFEVNPK